MKGMKDFYKGLKKGFKNFGVNVSTIVNTFLLSLVYLFGVGITCLFARIASKRFLDLEVSRKKETYWSDLNLKKKDVEKYYKQF